MRFLVLTDVFSPCPQSASQRVSSFAHALALRASEVVVLTSTRCSAIGAGSIRDENLLVYDFRLPRFSVSFSSLVVNPFSVLFYFMTSLVIALSRKVDFILSSVPNGDTAIAGFVFSKIFRVPLVIDLRDLYPIPPREFPFLGVHLPQELNRILTWVFSILYRNSDKLISVDDNIREEIIRFGVDPEKILVISNGADTSVYKPLKPKQRVRVRSEYGLPLDKLIFVYAGALVWYYSLDSVIRALRQLVPERNDFQLLVISHHSCDAQKRLVKELGLQDYVLFAGPFSVAETARILAACDVGIVVYRGETYFKTMYGSKIFSYMSCGLPVLVSGPPSSVLDELISKHDVGFFVGKPNVKDFADGLLYFLNNTEKAVHMGVKARRTVEKLYDRRKLGLKLVSLIGTVQADQN